MVSLEGSRLCSTQSSGGVGSCCAHQTGRRVRQATWTGMDEDVLPLYRPRTLLVVVPPSKSVAQRADRQPNIFHR